MDSQRVDMFMMTNGKYFPEAQLPMLRESLLQMEEKRSITIHALQYKDPMTALIISLFIGGLGIDRFYIGDTGLGIVKLLVCIFTCGTIGFIWWLIDLFLIMGRTREKNMERLMMML